MNQRKKPNSSKVNLTISVVFHSLLFGAVLFLAAREGILGKKLKMITVTMVPKEKKPEPPKEKPPELKAEQPKAAETPKVMAAVAPPRMQAAPPSEAPPSVAPAAAEAPAFEFNDGAKAVETVSDPNAVYKGLIEHALRSRWDRPEEIADENFAAEIELSVDNTGQLGAFRWVKGSGSAKWDDSVRAALAKTKTVSRSPPKGFPGKFVVRFDVQSVATENAIEVSSR